MVTSESRFVMYDVWIVQTLDGIIQFEMLTNSTHDDWMQRIARWKVGVG